jgi:hypothetical protein
MKQARTNQPRAYVALHAPTWTDMRLQVKAVLNDCWHRHAGHWQPESISLHVAPHLMRDAHDAAQRDIHLPQLVAWLRQQGRAVSVLGVDGLPEHRLYLHPPMDIGAVSTETNAIDNPVTD